MPTTITREESKQTVRAAVCAGCDQPMRPEEQYCPTCGAPRPRRITLARLFNEARSKLINLDFKFIRTLRDLILRPGATIRRYVEGNRQRISNPIWFAFITVTLYIAVNNFFTRSVSRFFDPLVNVRWFWPYLFFPALVPGVLLQRALFRKAGYNFAETYTFALLVCGQLVLLEAAYRPIASLEMPWIDWLFTLLMAAYFAWAVTSFAGDRKKSAWLRGLLAFVGYAGTATAILYGLVMWSTSKLG